MRGEFLGKRSGIFSKEKESKLDASRRAILIDELATIALANHDARLRFETRARRGSARRAMSILEQFGDG